MRSTRRRPREAELDDEIRPATRVRFLEFGRMFLALDPDGHRLRVLRPAVA